MYDEIKKISKINAALSLTTQAAKMFFHKDDPVSTHVVISAANEILTTLIKKRGFKTILGINSLLIRPEAKKEYIEIRRKSYNFFKHANKDASDFIDFNPNYNSYLLFENLNFLNKLEVKLTKEVLFFKLWHILYQPDIFYFNEKYQKEIERINMSASDFFDMFDETMKDEKFDLTIFQDAFTVT